MVIITIMMVLMLIEYAGSHGNGCGGVSLLLMVITMIISLMMTVG